MTPARIHLISALIAIAGGIAIALTGSLSAFLWFIASLVWFALAFFTRRTSARIPSPARKIVRRFSRLLMFS
jgi:hypothetical protein